MTEMVGASKCEICRAGQQARNSGRVDIAVLSLKSPGGPAGWDIRQCFYVAVLRQNCFFFRKTQSFLLMPSTDWMRPLLWTIICFT